MAKHELTERGGTGDSRRTLANSSAKGIRTRERLLEAAREVFQDQGYLSARITDIAERAGQSHASFYYYFASKEQIFQEVAAAVDKRLSAPLHDVVIAQSKLAPQQRITQALQRHFQSYRHEARLLTLIDHVARFDPVVNALRLDRHRRYTEQIAQTIAELQRRDLADTQLDPTVTATALGALTYRFAELWLVSGAIDCTDNVAVEQLSRIFENTLGLKAA